MDWADGRVLLARNRGWPRGVSREHSHRARALRHAASDGNTADISMHAAGHRDSAHRVSQSDSWQCVSRRHLSNPVVARTDCVASCVDADSTG